MSQPSYTIHIDTWFYRRPGLTTHVSNMCKDTLFSRMAYVGERRIGKSCFFLNELSPMLTTEGMMPIYINMRGSTPHLEFAKQLTGILNELDKAGVLLKNEIKELAIGKQIDCEEVQGQPKAATDIDLSAIKLLLKSVVEATGNSKIIFILDEFQYLSTSTVFDNFIYALRTLFDLYGSRITVIFIGSSHTQMTNLFEDSKAAFYQLAHVNEFPVIDDGFVDYCVNRLQDEYNMHIDYQQLLDFWNEIGQAPYWVVELLREVLENQRTLTQAILLVRENIRAEIY